MQNKNHKQKLEALGVFASSIAHDLNNILCSILGHVSYLRLADPDNTSHRESIVAIEDGARRAAGLTQQILEFAKGEEVELTTVNLSLVVAAGANLLRASLPESVSIVVNDNKEDVYVYGDESQLSQVILNLLVNARDALPGGGLIEVELVRCSLQQTKSVGELELEPGEYVSLVICDNGEGIPKAVRNKIFEPFFTTKKDFGTGLGLATVFSIVKAHRGAIVVDSEEGKGSRFEVYLPLSSPEDSIVQSSEDSQRSEESLLPGGSERILVVDDEESVRTVIQRSLEHLGYDVVEASNGNEAIEVFTKDAAGFGLVILDMIMPHMPGDELFYKLKEIDSSVAVLIASGYSSDGRTKAVLRDGGLGFLQKPFAVEELAQEVRRCIDLGAK